MNRPVLELVDVSKRYRSGRPARLRDLVQSRRLQQVERVALSGVDLTVHEGEVVGVVGRNGGGKSTLLRLAGGLTEPTTGSVRRHVPVSGLLSLGATASGELTGRDNAVTAAVLAGLSPDRARELVPQIASFAELEHALDDPLRTYSDGMRVRLAFAAAVVTEPRLLLVDEVLAVGDLAFQEKCLSRIEDLRDHGCAVVVASHVLEHLRRMARRVVWLRGGRVHMDGVAAEVLDAYSRAADERSGPAQVAEDGGYRKGSGEVLVVAARCLGADGDPASAVPSGGSLTFALRYERRAEVETAVFGVAVRRAGDDRPVIDLTTETSGAGPVRLGPTGEVRVRLDRLDLVPGLYYIDHGAYASDWDRVYDHRWDGLSVRVTGAGSAGVVQPPHHWTAG